MDTKIHNIFFSSSKRSTSKQDIYIY